MKLTKNTLWCLAWICGVASSNIIITNYGPAYSVLTAFALIGLSITSRDFLHEAWAGNGLKWKLGALIASGGVLSYLIQADAGRIALASVIAFTLSEAVDSIIYQALRKRGYYTKVNGSNAVSSGVDSLLFPVLAFGGFPWLIILGQFVAKTCGGAVWAWMLKNQSKAAVVALFAVTLPVSGAGVEHHWDSRGYQTTTLEHFMPGTIEAYGFADIDHNDSELIYAEAMLYANKGSWAATAQINGGRAEFFDIPAVGLFGARYKGFEVLVRTDSKVQLTYVWFKMAGRWTFKGFADVWGDADHVTILIEPQIWYRLTEHLDIGAEIEFSRNLSSRDVEVHPTIAIRIRL
tara:strand:- start:42 stop:1085 length:1044 start_codon:yes stop_codon:yes gene_type:complete